MPYTVTESARQLPDWYACESDRTEAQVQKGPAGIRTQDLLFTRQAL